MIYELYKEKARISKEINQLNLKKSKHEKQLPKH